MCHPLCLLSLTHMYRLCWWKWSLCDVFSLFQAHIPEPLCILSGIGWTFFGTNDWRKKKVLVLHSAGLCMVGWAYVQTLWLHCLCFPMQTRKHTNTISQSLSPSPSFTYTVSMTFFSFPLPPLLPTLCCAVSLLQSCLWHISQLSSLTGFRAYVERTNTQSGKVENMIFHDILL